MWNYLFLKLHVSFVYEIKYETFKQESQAIPFDIRNGGSLEAES